MEDKTSSNKLETIPEAVSNKDNSVFRTIILYLVPPGIVILILTVLWEAWVRIKDVPIYLFPTPSAVLDRLVSDIGFFGIHAGITVIEAAGGFILGSSIALVLGILMAHSGVAERTLFPIALLIKVTPIVAVAPLFVIWFGFGAVPKILIAALITFFPVMVNTLIGLKSVNPGALDYLIALDASDQEILMKLRFPSALPYIFAAFRIALPLSVIGAVVGEWFTGDRGLGSVIIVAHNNIDMPTLFSAVITLAVIGVSLTVALSYLEKKVLFWHDAYIAS
jgi:ABC-type nitrate/sulfonate/bicarbonate transport system permease component